MAIMYSTIGGHVFCIMHPCREMGNLRLFVLHTRRCAGSGYSVKAKPFGAASRALTFRPWLPASYTRGRRTRKPPVGAQSKEARRPEAQRHKKAFSAAHVFFAYRHMVQTLHANPSRCMLHRVFSIHIACFPPRVHMPAPSCAPCCP